VLTAVIGVGVCWAYEIADNLLFSGLATDALGIVEALG
jgi:hypothetical protein